MPQRVHWEILDYVTDGGENVMRAWLHGEQVTADGRRAINARLRLFRLVAPNDLGRPPARVKPLHARDRGEGLVRVRVDVPENGIQVAYRPLAAVRPGVGPAIGQIIFLGGAVEVNDVYLPPNAIATAHDRMRALETGRARQEPISHVES